LQHSCSKPQEERASRASAFPLVQR
jgi:hypothetical protein